MFKLKDGPGLAKVFRVKEERVRKEMSIMAIADVTNGKDNALVKCGDGGTNSHLPGCGISEIGKGGFDLP